LIDYFNEELYKQKKFNINNFRINLNNPPRDDDVLRYPLFREFLTVSIAKFHNINKANTTKHEKPLLHRPWLGGHNPQFGKSHHSLRYDTLRHHTLRHHSLRHHSLQPQHHTPTARLKTSTNISLNNRRFTNLPKNMKIN
jgi:hypothetical protein